MGLASCKYDCGLISKVREWRLRSHYHHDCPLVAFPCPACHASFQELDHILAHITTVHTKENKYQRHPTTGEIRTDESTHWLALVTPESKAAASETKACRTAVSVTMSRKLDQGMTIESHWLSRSEEASTMPYIKVSIDDPQITECSQMFSCRPPPPGLKSRDYNHPSACDINAISIPGTWLGTSQTVRINLVMQPSGGGD